MGPDRLGLHRRIDGAVREPDHRRAWPGGRRPVARDGPAEEGRQALNRFQLITLRRAARVVVELGRDVDPAAVVPLSFTVGAVRVSGRLYADEAAAVGRAILRAVRAAYGPNRKRRKKGAKP